MLKTKQITINKILTAFIAFTVVNISTSQQIFAQEEKTNEFGVTWGGFIRTDMYWDTRTTTGGRESMLMYLPNNEELNAAGEDVNAVPNFTWGTMGSRLNAKIAAPNFLRATTSGYVEIEFMGKVDAQSNVLNIRHAYLDLDWGRSKLTVGQTWNPMCVPETAPLTVSLNGGRPIAPSVRNPQIRYTQQLSNTFFVQATAFTERDVTSTGPLGNSIEYQRNTLTPAFNLLFRHKALDNSLTVGASGEFKTIKPYSFVNKKEVNGALSSFAANVFFGCEVSDFTFRLNGFYGGNMTDLQMLGGYALVSGDMSNGGDFEYTPFNNLAVTADLGYSIHKNAKIGIFGGMNMNLGTTDEVPTNTATYTAFNALVDKLIRVAPRFTYQAGKVQIGAEVEYTQASYGKVKEPSGANWNGKWSETTDVSNIRFLLATTLFF